MPAAWPADAGPSRSQRIDAQPVERRIQNCAGISTAPARARHSATLRKSRRPAATLSEKIARSSLQARLLNKSAPAIRVVAADFFTASAVENSKSDSNSRHGFSQFQPRTAAHFSVRRHSQKNSLPGTGRKARLIARACQILLPKFRRVLSELEREFSQNRFQNLARTF